MTKRPFIPAVTMPMQHPQIATLSKRDPRYSYEAYEFLFSALAHTQQLLGRTATLHAGEEPDPSHHVRGPELLDGIRDLAVREFGFMARTVFHMWGIDRTDDWGEIVFNLIEANLLSKTDQDSRADFRNVFDLDQVLVRDFKIRRGEED
jgi:uncharacterized repeat protein (TIGR04138 family)